MRSVLLALALSLTAVPAFAFGTIIDLPTLTWPQDDQTTSSTKGCEAATQTAPQCKCADQMGGLLVPVFVTYGRENGVGMAEAVEQGVRRGRKFDQVLDGARTVFLRDGFDGASVDDIAREAGVSKATLYAYFPDKQVLFREICAQECLRQADESIARYGLVPKA